MIDALVQDLRYAVRSLARTPGFTLVVVLTLALGIGGTAAVFSALELAVLRPPPYPQPDRLVALDVTAAEPGTGVGSIGWSYPKFETMRGATTSLELVTARAGRDLTLAGGAEPVRVRTEAVSPSYFALLEVGRPSDACSWTATTPRLQPRSSYSPTRPGAPSSAVTLTRSGAPSA